MKIIAMRVVFVGAALYLCSCGGHRSSQVSQEELVRRTQELMDAVAPGNQEPWKKYLAADATYFDEKGRAMDKAALLQDVAPMPTGYSGSIRVLRPTSHIFRDIAILSYDLDESETIFGQELKARYHGTDTWMRRNGEWQIVAGQMLRYYEDPAPAALDLAEAKKFLGKYQLAPGIIREVTAENGELFVQRTGRGKDALLPEAADIYFRKGVEGRILFRRGAAGQPDLLIDRRNNEDTVWKRIQ